MPRTEYCASCEQTVRAEWPHSCYNAKQVRAVRDAEAAVVASAEKAVAAYKNNASDDSTWEDTLLNSDAIGDLIEKVRALHAARQGEG